MSLLSVGFVPDMSATTAAAGKPIVRGGGTFYIYIPSVVSIDRWGNTNGWMDAANKPNVWIWMDRSDRCAVATTGCDASTTDD